MKASTLEAVKVARDALDKVFAALETNELRDFRKDPLMVAVSELEFELQKYQADNEVRA